MTVDADILEKKRNRNRAMLGIYQACSECKGAAIPDWAGAIPLNEAVELLLKDDQRDAFSIRQRALVRLLRAKVHRRHPHGAVVDRLAEEVGCTPDAVRMAVDDPALDGPTKEKNCFAVLETAMPAPGRDVEANLEQRTPTTSVVYSPTSLISTVTGTVEIPGEPDDFASMVDPRCWATMPDSPFEAAFETDPRGWNGVGEPPARSSGKTVPGSNWKGVFYEDVAFRMNDATQSRFRNLLHIEQTKNRDGIRAAYRLYQALSTQVGLFVRRGGVDVDHGFCSASRTEREGWTEYKVEKSLRFTDATPNDTGGRGWDYGQTMNYLTPSILGMWIEALMTEVSELAFARAGGSA